MMSKRWIVFTVIVCCFFFALVFFFLERNADNARKRSNYIMEQFKRVNDSLQPIDTQPGSGTGAFDSLETKLK